MALLTLRSRNYSTECAVMGKWDTGPAYIPVTPDWLEERELNYSRNGWPRAQWMAVAGTLLAEGFTVLLYEDKPKNWRHFRITRVGNPLQIKLGLFYGDGDPPIAVHGCDILCRRGGTKPSEALDAVREAFHVDVDTLDYFEVIEEETPWGDLRKDEP